MTTEAKSTALTTPIEIRFPEITAPHLRIVAGACILRIRPGSGEPWVLGSYHDPSGSVALHVTEEAEGARLAVASDAAHWLGLLNGLPTLELALGTGRPYALTIAGGASENQFELGGIPLTSLALEHGAAKVTLGFSTVNPVEMSLFKLSIGAGAIEAHGLGNAGFVEMLVEGGAAGVQLFFDGLVRHEGQVRIKTGLSGVELFIPPNVAAEVTSSSVLGGCEADPGFSRRGDAYCTPAGLSGAGPLLRIQTTSALGGVRLRMPSLSIAPPA